MGPTALQSPDAGEGLTPWDSAMHYWWGGWWRADGGVPVERSVAPWDSSVTLEREACVEVLGLGQMLLYRLALPGVVMDHPEFKMFQPPC